MSIIKKFLRDISSSLLMIAGYSLLFFIAFNGIYLINRMSEKQPDTVIGNYMYKENYRVTRRNVKPEDGYGEFDGDKNIRYVLSALETTQGNILLNMQGVIKGAAKSHTVSVMLSWNEPCSRPLKSGNYPDFNAIEDVKAAVIGEYFQDYIERDNGKEYINVNGENYLVTGVFKGMTDDGMDSSLVLFYDELDSNVKEAIAAQLYSNYMEIVLCGDSGNGSFIENVRNKISDNPFYDVTTMQANSIQGIQIIISKIKSVIMIMIVIFCIINSLAITNLWLRRRQPEIAIRKACGYSNFQVIKLIILDMIKLIGAAIVLAAVIELCYMLYFGHNVESWYIYRYCAYLAALVLLILLSSVLLHIKIIVSISPAKGVQH